MATPIKIREVERCVWFRGPYIFFYNGNCKGYNSTLVTKMNEMANKYPSLKVHVIDWQEKKMINHLTKDEEMNKVSLYFEKKLEDEVLCPDDDRINQLFKKAIDFFNINIDKSVQKAGSKILKNINSPDVTKIEYLSVERQEFLKNQKQWTLNQKIIFKEEKKEAEILTGSKKIPILENNTNSIFIKEANDIKVDCLPIKTNILKRKATIISSTKDLNREMNITKLPNGLVLPHSQSCLLKNAKVQNNLRIILRKSIIKSKSPKSEEGQNKQFIGNSHPLNKRFRTKSPQK